MKVVCRMLGLLLTHSLQNMLQKFKTKASTSYSIIYVHIQLKHQFNIFGGNIPRNMLVLSCQTSWMWISCCLTMSGTDSHSSCKCRKMSPMAPKGLNINFSHLTWRTTIWLLYSNNYRESVLDLFKIWTFRHYHLATFISCYKPRTAPIKRWKVHVLKP